MREDLRYPSRDAVASILIKIGIDPSSRYDEHDQDYEYTTCKLDELEEYVSLYAKSDTTIFEKRVLGCYFLECLNEHIQMYEKEHHAQKRVFNLLHSDIEIHETELAYWADTSDPNEENWWPITKALVEWQKT